MSLNKTGFDTELFYAVNSAVNFVLFAAFPLPFMILCGVFVVALLFAKGINWKMRVTLITVLTPEVIKAVGSSISYIGYPARVFNSSGSDLSCTISDSLILIGGLDTIFVAPFFAITVHIFLKYDPSKLKWSGIIMFIFVNTVLALAIGVIQAFEGAREKKFSSNGFCVPELSVPENTIFLIILAIVLGVTIVLSVGVVLVLSIQSYCYIKKNTVSSDSGIPSPVKKALTKVLAFLAIKTVLVVLQYGIVSLFFSSQNAIGVAGLYYTVEVSYWAITIIFPFLSLVLLKPLHDALKQMCKTLCCSCKSIKMQPKYGI